MIADADLCLWLLDGSAPPVWPGESLGTVQYVVNKCDLPPGWDHATVPEAVLVSARTGEGLGELCSIVVARLVPDPPPPGAAVPFTPQLCAGIVETQRALTTSDIVEARRILAGLRDLPEHES
jgi:tRNA modification GTPase